MQSEQSKQSKRAKQFQQSALPNEQDKSMCANWAGDALCAI
jgi:hypothetical protein